MPIDMVLALAIAASSPGAAAEQDKRQVQSAPVVKKTKRTKRRMSEPARRSVPVRTDQIASDPAGTVPPGAPGTDDPLLPGSKPNR